MTIYYITNDIHNPTDIVEISRLSEHNKVIAITNTRKNNTIKVKQFVVKDIQKKLTSIITLWLKLCVIFAQIPNNSIGRRYNELNIYRKSNLIKTALDFTWKFKNISVINKILPKYTSIALIPFQFYKIKSNNNKYKKDIVVYNSLFINHPEFIYLIRKMRRNGATLVANVRSWDNPYYIQFDTSADFYLTWSSHMDKTIETSQYVKSIKSFNWGPNQFNQLYFYNNRQRGIEKKNVNSIKIGYAAAFGDSILAFTEYMFICQVSEYLETKGLKHEILYRPYPTINPEVLKNTHQSHNIKFADINSKVTDRYGDGREIIRFGSAQEKYLFLQNCDIFLSFGTTFTIEAFLTNTPIAHLFISEGNLQHASFQSLFKRVEITCIHFTDYLSNAVNFTSSLEELHEVFNKEFDSVIDPDLLRQRLGINNLEKQINNLQDFFTTY